MKSQGTSVWRFDRTASSLIAYHYETHVIVEKPLETGR
jgi:hypothetical protein